MCSTEHVLVGWGSSAPASCWSCWSCQYSRWFPLKQEMHTALCIKCMQKSSRAAQLVTTKCCWWNSISDLQYCWCSRQCANTKWHHSNSFQTEFLNNVLFSACNVFFNLPSDSHDSRLTLLQVQLPLQHARSETCFDRRKGPYKYMMSEWGFR